jgi:hypothetical protein
MRRKGRVVRVVTEAYAGGQGKGSGRKVELVTYKKLPGRGSTNPRNRKSIKASK